MESVTCSKWTTTTSRRRDEPMIIHHPYDSLGGANHGWLDAKHHFSFAGYRDPDRMSHGELLVINDDRIAPNNGFEPHLHRDMEIITYVRKGAITHEDDKGNKGRTTAGNVQVMSAGSGIRHSEFNHEEETTNLFQIWILPKTKGITPRWDAAEFPKGPVSDRLTLLVSGAGDAPLSINQDATVHAGALNAGTNLTHAIKGKAYVLISEGEASIDGINGKKGDGFAVSGQDSITIEAGGNAEILVIGVPGLVENR